jgi:endonuclease YncB( thermonuclease family)
VPRYRVQLRHFVRRSQQIRVPWIVPLLMAAIGAMGVLYFADKPEPPLAGAAIAVDGDTIRIGARRIRLLGLDAPELGQDCTDALGANWGCGLEAAAAMRGLLSDSETTCTPNGTDRYHRMLAHCMVRGIDLSHAMVMAGLAVSEGDYDSDQALARASGRGIWAGPFELPVQWRREHGQSPAPGFTGGFQDWFR